MLPIPPANSSNVTFSGGSLRNLTGSSHARACHRIGPSRTFVHCDTYITKESLCLPHLHPTETTTTAKCILCVLCAKHDKLLSLKVALNFYARKPRYLTTSKDPANGNHGVIKLLLSSQPKPMNYCYFLN